jgi:hypothetical protein
MKMCVYMEWKCDTSFVYHGSWGAFQLDQALLDALAILPSVHTQLAWGQTFGIGARVNLLSNPACYAFSLGPD